MYLRSSLRMGLRTLRISGPEILSVRNPIRNEGRKYIAGLDPIEEWDARMMEELNIPLQSLSPVEQPDEHKVISFPAKLSRASANISAARERLLAAQG